MFDPVSMHVIFSFWDCSASRFCPKYWAVPHRSAGGTTSGFGARRLAPDYGQPPLRRNDQSQMEDPRPVQDLERNGRGDRFDRLMDAGVRTNEDMGRRGVLQAACWETTEEFGRVTGQRRLAHADSARELAE